MASTGNARRQRVKLDDLLAGELQAYNRLAAGPIASYGTPVTADALVKNGAGICYGVIITTATAVAQIDIRDATSAGAGTVICTIPSGTAVGQSFLFNVGVICTTGIYIDYAAGATGTLVPIYV
jgi:hypothetical protein